MRKQGRGKGMRDGRREEEAEDKRGAVTDKEGWEVKGRWRPCKVREESIRKGRCVRGEGEKKDGRQERNC